MVVISVVTIPNFAMRYVSRYLGHDAIRIAILVYRINQCLYLQFFYDGNAISSATVQGSVSLPHYRTLEVRPGRIS